MTRLAAVAGQPPSNVRMPREAGAAAHAAGGEEAYGVVSASVTAPGGQPLVTVEARIDTSRDRPEYGITVFPQACLDAAVVCRTVRTAAGLDQRLRPGEGESYRCDTLPHGTTWRDVAPPPAWDAATAPRLTLRVVTGTEDGAALGALATRFNLYAEAPPARDAKRQRGDAGAVPGPGRERIGRALLTYANGEMDERGPTLELPDVKERWRRRGVGTALLGAVERFMTDATSPRPTRQPVLLQLCDAAMARPFFEATGFSWVDEPLCEEGVKPLFAPPRCTCGACTGGVLSAAFAVKLVLQADMYQDTMQEALDDLGTRTQPLSADELEGISYITAACFPPAAVERGVTPQMLGALHHALLALRATCEARELPTPAAVLARWPTDDPVALAARQLLFAQGCSLEHIVGFIIDVTRHAEDVETFEYIYDDKDVRECENDFAAAAVRVAALGPAFPALFPGCVTCADMYGGVC